MKAVNKTNRSGEGSCRGPLWRLLLACLSLTVAILGVSAMRPTATNAAVVGLGDSVMAGTNCDCSGIVADYSRLIGQRQGSTVSGLDYSANGATTSDLDERLQNDQTVRAAVARSSVVLISIGANDFVADAQRFTDSSCDFSCYSPDVTAMKTRLTHSLQLVRELRHHRPTQIFVFAYWNVFTDGQVARTTNTPAFNAFAATLTDHANQAICAAARSTDARCVDLKTVFTGRSGDDLTDLLADDGDHPNGAGENLIVESLVKETDTIE